MEKGHRVISVTHTIYYNTKGARHGDIPVIPGLERLRQEDLKLGASQGLHSETLSSKKNKKQSKTSKTSTGRMPVIPALVRWRPEIALKVTKSSSNTQ